jgi:precorrin-6B methylase 2
MQNDVLSVTSDTLESVKAAELDGDHDTVGGFAFGRTQQEIGFILDVLGVENGSTLLDAGCGGGRLALELARRGHAITGVDRDVARITRARSRAVSAGLHERTLLHACAIAQLAYVSHFDGAYAYGGSFGGEGDEADIASLRAIMRALKPGARLLLEHANMLHLARKFAPREWHPTASGGRIMIERQWDIPGGCVFERRILRDALGLEREQWFTMRVYAPAELARLFTMCGGFEPPEIVSAPDRTTPSLDTPRIAISARRTTTWS